MQNFTKKPEKTKIILFSLVAISAYQYRYRNLPAMVALKLSKLDFELFANLFGPFVPNLRCTTPRHAQVG